MPQHYRPAGLRYRPAVFFHHLESQRCHSRTVKFGMLSKRHIISFLFSSSSSVALQLW
jgi:hypothetical protein